MSGALEVGATNFLPTVSRTLSRTARRCGWSRVSILYFSSVRCGTPSRDHRADAVTIHEQPAPELRNGLWPESPQHGQLRFSKCLSLIRPGGELAIELPHDGEAERVVGAPQICHHGSRTGSQEWSNQAGDSLLAVHITRAGVTGGEGDKGRAQTQVQDLPCLEETILTAARQKHQRRACRILGAHDSMRSKMDDPVLTERLLLQRLFGGRFADQNCGSRATQRGGHSSGFVVGRRQRGERRAVKVVHTTTDCPERRLRRTIGLRRFFAARRRTHSQGDAVCLALQLPTSKDR